MATIAGVVVHRQRLETRSLPGGNVRVPVLIADFVTVDDADHYLDSGKAEITVTVGLNFTNAVTAAVQAILGLDPDDEEGPSVVFTY